MKKVFILTLITVTFSSMCYAMANRPHNAKNTAHETMVKNINTESNTEDMTGTKPSNAAMQTGVIPGSPQKVTETGNADITRSDDAVMTTKPTGI